jgi:hypothetical protein
MCSSVVTKIPEKVNLEDWFWLMVSVNGCLALLVLGLWQSRTWWWGICGGTGSRDVGRGQSPNILLKGTPQCPDFPQLGPIIQ